MNAVNFKSVVALGLILGTAGVTGTAFGEDTVESKKTEYRSSSEQSGPRRSNKSARNKKTTTITTTTTTNSVTPNGENPNSVDYRVQAEKTKAAAKVDAAEAKVEAAETRADARIEATETKAKAQIEATQTRTQAEKEAMQKRTAAEREATEVRADNRDYRSGENAGIFERSGHLEHRFGVYLSGWGDPFPAPIGLNVAYNLTDYLRATLGAGSNDDRTFSLSTFGVGVKGVVPNWSLTPVVGLGVSTTTGGAPGSRNSIRGFNPAGSRAYATAGVEWQAGLGLNFGAGWAQSFRTGENGTLYFNLGMYL